MAATSLEKGTALVNGNLVTDMKKKQEDENKIDDQITMEILRQIADEVNPMIKFTADLPSDHEDGKISVLDLNIKLNTEMSFLKNLQEIRKY